MALAAGPWNGGTCRPTESAGVVVAGVLFSARRIDAKARCAEQLGSVMQAIEEALEGGDAEGAVGFVLARPSSYVSFPFQDVAGPLPIMCVADVKERHELAYLATNVCPSP